MIKAPSIVSTEDAPEKARCFVCQTLTSQYALWRVVNARIPPKSKTLKMLFFCSKECYLTYWMVLQLEQSPSFNKEERRDVENPE